MSVVDIEREQEAAMPRDDLSPYAGQWVALRDGHVVTAAIDPVTLQHDPAVRDTDDLLPVPIDGTAILIA